MTNFMFFYLEKIAEEEECFNVLICANIINFFCQLCSKSVN